ncbi:Ankyrin repeat domain-containing protein, chloroplastic [Morella rubra]|uniref:Ankyrin repeat domain-containing protein, chloroplastic n=1 Tax=Morella rubra TaxID=262757 RepID=A0A6A1UMQ5_9ROSI|nr:Ankyrin repeat domain-containing protein, chloroplastic [Morella rubra]
MADSPRKRSEAINNPGDTLYVTGLSQRVSERELEEHFSKEGKVASCFLVVEPRTRVSRGFAFVTMETVEDANRCVKYLNQSVLEGRYITVEKSRRKRARTPTPGHYLGLKSTRDYGPPRGSGDRGRYRGRESRDDYGYRRSPRRSPYRGGRESPPYGGRSRRDRSRSLPYSPSPERKYARGSSPGEPPCRQLACRACPISVDLIYAPRYSVAACALDSRWPFQAGMEVVGKRDTRKPQTMALSSALVLNYQSPPKIFPFLPTHPHTVSLSITHNPLSSPRTTLNLPRKPHSFSPTSSFQSSLLPIEDDDAEEHVIGDCVVFEEGVFEDPGIQGDLALQTPVATPNKLKQKQKHRKPVAEVEPENLVPEQWKEVQAEINITKKERRKIAQQLEYGSRVEKNRKGYEPIRNVNVQEYLEFKEAKLAQLKPLVLDNPSSFLVEEEEEEKIGEMNATESSSERVAPKNPRWAVYGRGLEDVTEFFNNGNYTPGENESSEGRRKLFTKEEKFLLNRKNPDVAAATSAKWLPLHTLAASGEFYLMDALLKHNADINAVDKDGWSALHKAIIGKKQAITNYLLRESANPFVLDKDGANLMHYAVQTASSQGIKILLLYNVDINHQDNDGWTPLHVAVQARRTDVVRLLLIKGAEKTLKNKDGLTPLDLCLYSGQDTRTYELIKLLKQLPKVH